MNHSRQMHHLVLIKSNFRVHTFGYVLFLYKKEEAGTEQNNMSQMRMIKSIERVENDSCGNSMS